MVRQENHTWTRALGLGATTGLRSMLGPALLSYAASRSGLKDIEDTPFAVLASPGAAKMLALLAIGEAVADKTPVIPSRTSAPVLIQRAAFGAAVGAALYTAHNLDGKTGAFLGTAAAVAGALAGQGFRQASSQAGASLLPALAEDALALGLGLLSLRRIVG